MAQALVAYPAPNELPKEQWSADALSGNEPSDDVARPDIEWVPSFKTYKARVEALAALGLDRPTTLPAGWPEEVTTSRVWSKSDFTSESQYVVEFSKAEIAEIEAGLAHFKGLPGELGPDDVSRKTYPLPTLATKLDEISVSIHNGIGFAILRGLEPKKYSKLDNVLIYLGITSYIAETRGCQDYDGRMLVHIQDIQEELRKYGKRGPFSPYHSRTQPFHTDRCDILALYAMDVAPMGGESFLASSAKIYNEIAKERPDVIHTLIKDDWVFDEFHEGDYHKMALLHDFPGHGPGFSYSRRPLTGAYFCPHFPGVPAMTEVQAEALDMVHFIAKKHAIELKLKRGDLEIFNNHALMHARSSFIDDDSGKRHLIRLWLKSDDHAWTTPLALEESSFEIYGESEFRRNPVWDIERSPPQTRGTLRRMKCN